MLQIRKQQLDSLDQASEVDFHQRLMRWLHQELPEATREMDDAALLDWIVQTERRAARYGITSEAGIAQSVCLTFAAGPKFDEIPEVRAFLEEPGPDPEEKLDMLVDYLNLLEEDPNAQPDDLMA